MKNIIFNKLASIGLLFLLISSIPTLGSQINKSKVEKNYNVFSASDVKTIEFEISFSYPEIEKYGNYWIVRVKETNHNRYVLFGLDPGKPVLPVNISIFNLEFGSKIINIEYEHSTPIVIDLPGKIAFCRASYDTQDFNNIEIPMDYSIYEGLEPYPSDWVSYHTGGGLLDGKHTTFLVTRVYPVKYFALENQLQFIEIIKVKVSYLEPTESIINDSSIYDLLIIAPKKYFKEIQPLVCHKNNFGVRTKLVSLDYIYDRIWFGRDRAEKIKLFIKEAIAESGIKYVLLVGGIKGQTCLWDLPIRYSRVIPTEEQEYPEQSFISDLYYADIYDSEGNFSSWDSNNDNVFAVWNESFKEDMDLYPDVYLGRIACQNSFEVKIMVKKIINYEKTKCADDNWFKNLLLVAGDSYNDIAHYNEGELISEKAIEIMPSFNPVRLYAREDQDIDRKTVNKAMNNGSGFAYFCGHGSVASWSTHFPPNGTEWTTGYEVGDMIYLKNREKLPITIVGGCHNGQFDVSMWNIVKGFLKDGFRYFRLKPEAGQFWYLGWLPNCWAWWLTSKPGGGSIATIANTGLGTHGDGDLDNNTIPDYLEILDGWLELRFFELYGRENKDILGENHAETITGYLHRFLGDETKMDVKMVQQWELFGDPSLKIGGYE